MLRLRAGVASDVGRVRAVNQDSVGLADGVFVVADGMGGHSGGEVASQVAVDTFLAVVGNPSAETMVDAINQANEAILARAAEDPELAGMGTTLCALGAVAGDEPRLVVTNVGDSRVYVYADGELVQVSEDHSLVAGLVRQGRLRPEEAETHPQRNILTRALGVENRVLVDAWELVPVVGDRYVLCSDGLFNEVTDEQIGAVLRRLADPDEAADELMRLANEHGGRDNVTVVIVDVEQADTTAGAAETVMRVTRARRSMAHIAGLGVMDLDTVDPESTLGRDADAEEGPADVDIPDDVVDREAYRVLKAMEGGESPSVAKPTRPPSSGGIRFPRVTWRVGLFLAALLAVLGLAGAAVATFTRTGYFVGIDNNEVVIFHGREGGFLWIEPSITERTGIPVDQLSSADRFQVEQAVELDSLTDAQGYVSDLSDRTEAFQDRIESGEIPPPPAGVTTDQSGDRL